RHNDVKHVNEMFHLAGHGARSVGELSLALYLYVVPDRNRIDNAAGRMSVLRANGYTITWSWVEVKTKGSDVAVKEYVVSVSKEIDGTTVRSVLGTKTPEHFFNECYVEGDIVEETIAGIVNDTYDANTQPT